MDTNKFAYLAGYIDGDGCFFVRTYIQKPKNIMVFEYSIQICSVDKDTIQYFKKEFEGTFSKRPEKRNDRKDTYIWVVKTKQSLHVAEKIINFLISKKAICKLFIYFGNSISPNRGEKITDEVIQFRKDIFTKIKEEIHMNNNITKEIFNNFKIIKKCRDPSESDLAYFAGLIDAEGCFRIAEFQSKRTNRSRSYISTLEIGNTKSPIFPWIMERFGGTITYRSPISKNHNPMIIWSLKSKALNQILYKIYPFLRFKKERCKKLIELEETMIPNGGNRKSEEFKSKFAEIQNFRESIAVELHKLNAKGKHY